MSQLGSRVTLLAVLRGLPGAEDLLASLLDRHADDVRREPGNIAFAAYVDRADALAFHVYEQYTDQRAFEAHLAAPHSVAFNAHIAPLVTGGKSHLTMLAPLRRTPR